MLDETSNPHCQAGTSVSTAVTHRLLEHSNPQLTNDVYVNVDPVLYQAVNSLPVADQVERASGYPRHPTNGRGREDSWACWVAERPSGRYNVMGFNMVELQGSSRGSARIYLGVHK